MENNSVTGLDLINHERDRQIARGHAFEADDRYVVGQLLHAATIYEIAGNDDPSLMVLAIRKWPWSTKEFNPSPDKAWNLIRAGALYQAEVERLDRAGLDTEMAQEAVERCALRIDTLREEA